MTDWVIVDVDDSVVDRFDFYGEAVAALEAGGYPETAVVMYVPDPGTL